MFKKLLVIFYIAAVLTIAGTAKAEDVLDLPLQQVTVNEDYRFIHVSGTLPHLCANSPRLKLTQEKPGQFVLSVVAPSSLEYCAQLIPGDFDLFKDLTSVVAELVDTREFKGQNISIYIPATDSYLEFSIGPQQLQVSYPDEQYQGRVLKLENTESYVLLLDDLSVVPLRNPEINFEKYKGTYVTTRGIPLQASVPVIDKVSLENSNLAPKAPNIDFFVTEISSAEE